MYKQTKRNNSVLGFSHFPLDQLIFSKLVNKVPDTASCLHSCCSPGSLMVRYLNFILSKMAVSSFSVLSNVLALSDTIKFGSPRRLINLLRQSRNVSVNSPCINSKCTARLVQHVNSAIQTLVISGLQLHSGLT